MVADLYRKRDKVCGDLEKMREHLVIHGEHVPNDVAREYLLQGVARRLRLLAACIWNIYEYFPPETDERLQTKRLHDVEIQLQAFAINVSGIHDNWAWAYVSHLGVPLKREQIGLFNQRTQPFLTEGMRDYLSQDHIVVWYRQYAKNYRDALAHRIPLYIPPAEMSEAEAEKHERLWQAIWLAMYESRHSEAAALQNDFEAIGKPCFRFVHSLHSDPSRPVYLHPQVLCDAITVLELCRTMMREWFAPPQ